MDAGAEEPVGVPQGVSLQPALEWNSLCEQARAAHFCGNIEGNYRGDRLYLFLLGSES
jgi:hypothetical protein